MVSLATEPESLVTVTIMGVTPPVEVDATMLRFSASDWAAPRTVTVSATEDNNSEDEEVTLAHTAASSDTDYNIATAVDVVVTAVDDDVDNAAVTVTASDPVTVDEGAEAEYTILLVAEPRADVTVTITAEAGVSVDAEGGRVLTLTFTAANYNIAQTVTVTAEEDDDAVDSGTIDLTHEFDGGGYNDVGDEIVKVTVIDDDTAGIMISATNMEIREGASAVYTISLTAQPAVEPVNVRAESSNDEVFANPTSVTFTMANWKEPQSVTLTARQDTDDPEEHEAALTITHEIVGPEPVNDCETLCESG